MSKLVLKTSLRNSNEMNAKFLIFVLIFSLVKSDDYCSQDEKKLIDPRSTFDVDLKTFKLNKDIESKNVIQVITEGQGFDILKDLFEPQEIQHAKETIHYLIQKQGSKATHFQVIIDVTAWKLTKNKSFQGGDSARPDLQARVWNLLNKGKIFEKMVQHPTLLNITRSLIGDDMQLGSIASNTIFPGGSGQEPHIDYPYWDYYNKDHWPVPPKHPDVPYTMNVQWVIALDDLTEENGATSVRPNSQRKIEYPSNVQEYRGTL